MHLSVTYYRRPFPRSHRWRDDMKRIAATGFDTIYLFVTWATVESTPGEYDFSDLDELVAIAGENGIRVIFNLSAEMQPVWIPRLHPDSAMVDHMDRKVRSSTLAYDNFALMPGGCTDHPEIRAKIEKFYQAFTRHFVDVPHVLAWDCWNEMRWASQADGYVCFCEHTVARFRTWLKAKFGTLEAFNAATLRKYVDWEDVIPAKSQARNNTDVMLWQQFIMERTGEDLRWRYEQVKKFEPNRPVHAHAAFPSTFMTGEFLDEHALARGNDWDLARQVDGYGCSHFPAWINTTPAEYGARLESIRSATGDKPCWIAELQGGAAGHGPQVMHPVEAKRQTGWLWNGIARGMKGVNFWNWWDEGFGREAGGFGISGEDGHAEERLASIARSAKIIHDNEALFDAYRPAPAEIGVVFEPDIYHFDWSAWTKSDLAPPKEGPYPAGHSLIGYLMALERAQLPYDVIEPRHVPDLDQYKLIVMPWPMIVDGTFSDRLVEWVAKGGTLLTEPSLEAFTRYALFNYPAERRLPGKLGFHSSARRRIEDERLAFEIGGQSGTLLRGRWREDLTPAGGAPMSGLMNAPHGEGHVVAIDSFVGVGYWSERYPDFEAFMRGVAAQAGVRPAIALSIEDGELLQWRFGHSGDTPLLFVVNGSDEKMVELRFDEAPARSAVTDLATGETHRVEKDLLRLNVERGSYHVLRFET